MTKLPPGFIHEVPTHLTHPDVPLDPLTGVPFVDLENYCCGMLSRVESAPSMLDVHVFVFQAPMGSPPSS